MAYFSKRQTLAAVLLAASALGGVSYATPMQSTAETSAQTLEQGFFNPPNSARPRVWWHWMNGNVTKSGIQKDLEWMHRVGIGGVQNFDANLMTPQVVDERLVYMTPPWKDAFRFAVETAESLGLEFAIAASPGWSETGGPWVKPDDGMKKLVWSETLLRGGQRPKSPLAAPPRQTGPYQSAGGGDYHNALSDEDPAVPALYGRPVMVLAVPSTYDTLTAPVAKDFDGTPLSTAALSDADMGTAVSVAKGNSDAPGGVTFTYAKPVTIRSAQMFIPGAKPPFRGPFYVPILEAKLDGGWTKIADIPLTEAATTVGFPAVTASEFRVSFAPNTEKFLTLEDPVEGAEIFDFFAQKPTTHMDVGAMRLMAEPRLNRAEEKAGYGLVGNYSLITDTLAQDGIDPKQVVNLTDRVKADGTLDWTPPKGSNWRILNFGWSLTGKTNHPATPEATGLEVDKFDPAAVRRYLETYLGMYSDTVGADLIGKRGIRALLTDSIEVGAANWTPAMMEEFAKRRGYDARPWMPAITGLIVGSTAETEKFLYDYRLTLTELMTDAHYKTVADVAHEHGLKVYGEALENDRPTLGDDLAMRSHADVPMAALWTWTRESAPRTTLLGDMKGASSVAHIYGQNVVAAESMTSAFAPWAHAPQDLRRIIDMEFAHGVNLPVVHTSVHQPLDDKQPGLSLAIFGQFFNRHETWADMAKPWVDYMARSAYMLQQGRNHADVAVFVGEDEPITAQFYRGVPDDLPKQNAYDFISADALTKVVRVENGQIVTKGGARFAMLYLGEHSKTMTLPTLRKIAELVDAGAIVSGHRPQSSPSLADDKAAFDALIAQYWGGGKIKDSQSVEESLKSAGVAPDFTYRKSADDSEILFVHRTLADGEVYFVNNRAHRAENTEARFRVTGKQPEIWDAVTGTSRTVSYRIENGETIIPLDLAAEESLFIVFRKPATANAQSLNAPQETKVMGLGGPWQVAFQGGRGAPATVMMKTLTPLHKHSDAGIKYFSGVARYTQNFKLSDGAAKGERLVIDLGQIGDVAEVWVNGTLAGTSLFAPYRVDVTRHMKKGTNMVEVRVANLWVNRLIGDVQEGAAKITFTAAPTYRPDAPLRPSGLIGPVELIRIKG